MRNIGSAALNHKASSFKCELMRTGSGYRLELSGFLDEEAQFPALSSEGVEEFEVDFGGLNGFDFDGLAHWEEFCGRHANVLFRLRGCTPPIVQQANMNPTFLPRRFAVDSLQVPYHCESCGHDEPVLFRRDREYMIPKGGGFASLHQASARHVCTSESGVKPLTMASPEVRYFAFLKRSE